MKQGLPNFDCSLLTSDPFLFTGKNSPNIANSNHIFSGNGRDEAFILTYLAKVFCTTACLFRFQLSSVETEDQSWTISANFGSVLFHKKRESFKKFSNNVFVCQGTKSMNKIFNSSFHVKQHNTGKSEFVFLSWFLLLSTKKFFEKKTGHYVIIPLIFEIFLIFANFLKS